MIRRDIMKELFKGCMTVPNLLSLIRIILVPVFMVLFIKGYTLWAVSVLVVSALTDLVDGKIARKFNQISNLGKVLDPIADKISQMAIVVVLIVRFMQSSSPAMKAFSWVFLLFIAKELFMLGVGAYMLSVGLKPQAAEIYGKSATMIFYSAMILIICFGPEVGALSTFNLKMTMPEWLVIVLVIISLIMTFVALLSYVPDAWNKIHSRNMAIKQNQGENR